MATHLPAADEAAAASAPAEPLFFRSGGRPLYGVFHPPGRERAGAPVVVHCHTLGVEQLTSYRTEALMARRAAALGFPAFRFHARGHGDSGGDFADVTLGTLAEDARAAAEEALRRAGPRRIVWLGVRFGALAAAGAMRGRGDTAGLVLWEPVSRARDYFRSMLRGLLFSEVAKGKKPEATADQLLERVRRDGKVDVHGYYLHRDVVESALPADLAELLDGWSGPTQIVQIQERQALAPAHAALADALRQRGSAVSIARVGQEPGWHFVTNPAWEGVEVVQATAGWLDALA